MKKEVIFSVTLSLLAMTAMTDASSLSITVQPGPVEVKQGNDISLWCEVKQDTRRRVNRGVVPVIWESPPNFKTITSNCVSFVGQKYGIQCEESPWLYILTIKDVQWADKGKYRCIHAKHRGIVILKVLVPVRDVSLTSSKPLVLRNSIETVFNCTTDCGYPAPNISWFENGQPFKDNVTVTTTESGCSGDKEGQKRTISTILSVRGEKERKGLIISCKAGNVFGENKISREIVVTYDDPCGNLWCPPGHVCQATSKNIGVCVCGPSDLCDGHHKQVCGDDGIMYPSRCELHRMACINDKHIGIDYANNMCNHIVTHRPAQSTIGGIIAAAVVVPVLVLVGITVLIICTDVGRRCLITLLLVRPTQRVDQSTDSVIVPLHVHEDQEGWV